PGKSFFSAHEVSTCKISGCLSYRILDSGPDGTQTTLTKNGKEIEGMLSILDATKRASEANVVTKTGMTLAPLVRVIGNLKTGGALLAGETGIGLMSRVYESPMARNALLRLANTKAGTPAYERALNNAANAIRPILANDAT
ncbi:hypothetical protein MHI67_26375, partial [Escherichia coli]|nr:hypothetical protein [Escherichia coli]